MIYLGKNIKNRNKGQFKKEILFFFFLLIILIAQTFVISYQFSTKKQGHHSDEVQSYNFSNAWFSGYLPIDMDGKTINLGTWESGQVLRDALEVQSGQQFRYDSVFYNQHQDLSPPFHSLLLHTVCSFFPDTFSWWYAFSINIVALIVTGIFLFLLGREWFHSPWHGVILCGFYGFTTAALNSTIYLRMYGVLAMFSVMLVYLHIRLYHEMEESVGRLKETEEEEVSVPVFPKKKEKLAGKLAGITMVTVLGGMTHYYFLILAFFLTAFWGIWMLCKKRWKVLIIYLTLMAGSAALIVAAFPTVLDYMKSSTEAGASATAGYTGMLYSWEIIQTLSYILSNLTGLYLPGVQVLLAIFVSFLVLLIAFGIPLCFLFRRTDRFRNLKGRGVHFAKNFPKSLVCFLGRVNWIPLFLFLSVLLSAAVIAKISDIYAMGSYASRYLFFLMPVGAILWYAFFQKVCKWIFRKEWLKNIVVICLLLACAGNSYRVCGAEYFFAYESKTGVNLRELTKDSNCIFAVNSPGDLITMSAEFLDCKQFFNLPALYIDVGKEALEELEDTKTPLYLLVEKDAFFSMKETYGSEYTDENGTKHTYEDVMTEEEFLKKVSKLSYVTQGKYIDSINTFEGWLDIYRLN